MQYRRTRIKICGITTATDAAAAVAAGADALGVVLAPSVRQVSLEQAERALADVPPLVARVGVFVDVRADDVWEAVARLGLSAVQFCGDEAPETCEAAPVPVVKAFRVGTGFDMSDLEPFRGRVAALLLDSHSHSQQGGTGIAFDWQRARRHPEWAPLFLAGGLNPENVAEAISTVRPFAVDVSSGVESEPGRKDAARIRAFCDAVRAADAGLCATPTNTGSSTPNVREDLP